VSFIFHDVFSQTLEGIDPTALLSEKEIKTAIRNATVRARERDWRERIALQSASREQR
jgi:hypothetical protein